jgi:hypothetical protein
MATVEAARLARQLARRQSVRLDAGLRAGDIVTTGSYAGALEFPRAFRCASCSAISARSPQSSWRSELGIL